LFQRSSELFDKNKGIVQNRLLCGNRCEALLMTNKDSAKKKEKNPIKNSLSKKAEESLQEAQKALKKSLKREKELIERLDLQIATFAHDVRNPLNAMLAYSEVLKDELLGPFGHDTYKDYAKTLHISSLRLLDLCETVLDAAYAKSAKSESPHFPGTFQEIDAAKIITEASDLFAEQARKRGIKLKTAVSKDFPQIHTNPQHLYRAITNLLSNALKFTPKGGTVTIKARLDKAKDAIIVVIRDTGIGIPASQILEILQPFHRGPSLHGDKGSGLGLSIVNQLMTQLGGSLDISSKEKVGARVTLHFPRKLTRSASS
jgi:signal transduction histidine kinase